MRNMHVLLAFIKIASKYGQKSIVELLIKNGAHIRQCKVLNQSNQINQ